ncbi:MAG: hypothetical protein JJT85_11765 [Chromatiales bacterium]|nr:hypothetical protein [Chromatiales bacterium]
MDTKQTVRSRLPLGAVLILAMLPAPAVLAGNSPEAVVMTFNEAIGARDLQGLLGHFAEGSVQFAIRPAHAGMAPPKKVSSDLVTHWQTIGPVLFSVTESYTRTPEILASHVESEIATVWARITTRTVDRNSTAERSDSFSEVYLMVDRGDGWKIAGIAENRGTDSLVID